MHKTRLKNINKINKRADIIFYAIIVALPLLQFLIFYVYVNFNSFFLAFKNIDVSTGSSIETFVGFDNFRQLFSDIGGNEPMFGYAIKNSLVFFGLSLLISTPLGIIFSFYIFKKGLGHKFFQIILFIPSIICAMITVIMYRYFVDKSIPSLLNAIFGTNISLLFSENKLTCVFIYNFLMCYGTSVLTYVSAMNNISNDLFEAAKIDGANLFEEFFHIVLPQIFPTLSVFLIAGVSGVFVNQLNLFTFFDKNLDPMDYSVGYYIYKTLLYGGESKYPYLAALGLLITAIIAPLTFGLRKLFDKINPMGDK